MEHIETIDLKHRDGLTERFRQMHLQISDYTFANVYLFRNSSHYEFVTRECGLFVSGRNKQKQNYVMPLNDPRGVTSKHSEKFWEKKIFSSPSLKRGLFISRMTNLASVSTKANPIICTLLKTWPVLRENNTCATAII